MLVDKMAVQSPGSEKQQQICHLWTIPQSKAPNLAAHERVQSHSGSHVQEVESELCVVVIAILRTFQYHRYRSNSRAILRCGAVLSG